MSTKQIGVDIVANDDTAKGFDSANKRAEKFTNGWEKRARELAKAQNARLKASAKADGDRRNSTGAGASGRGFAAAEQAFGGGAVSGAVSARLSGVTAAASNLKSAFASASHEGAGLSEKLGAISAGSATAIGGIIGLGLATLKAANGWTEGGAALGRLSAGLGLSTKSLQEWQGAGERFGVDKESMGGALGGLAGTLHEAKYGRNNAALAAMNQLGLRMKLKADGSVDTGSMGLDLANAIHRQKDPQTQARIAAMFGVSGALPAFRQGGGALRANGADFGRYGAMLSNPDVATATRLYRKGVMAKQGLQRQIQAGQGLAARLSESAVDAGIAHERGEVDGRSGLQSAAHSLVHGAQELGREVEKFGGIIGQASIGFAGLALGAFVNRRTLGGRLNNPGNIRPVGGGGFARFASADAGLAAMGSQIVRDQDVHGAQTLRELIAGTVGPDGRRHWGYAPASDHNDSAGYAREIARTTGINGRFNAHDPGQLASIMSAMVARETGSRISPQQMLPIAQRIVLEVRGLPAGTRVTAHSQDQHGNHRPQAVGYAMLDHAF